MRMRILVALAAALCAAAPAVAATPPPGALLGEFAQNQLENCAAICPFAVQGALTVPAGALAAPAAFLGAAAAGSPVAALGAAAQSVTAPADAAMTGIIGNDLNQVVPRFQNGVLIGMVDLLRIGSGPGAVDTFRSDVLTALQQPLPPVAQTPPPLTPPGPFGIAPNPSGPLEVTAVEATNVFFAGAFYVPELSLLGATQTANAAATTLASTGDPVPAVQAAADAAQAVASADASILTSTVSTAATNVEQAVNTPTEDRTTASTLATAGTGTDTGTVKTTATDKDTGSDDGPAGGNTGLDLRTP